MERSSAMNNREKNQEHLSDIEFYRQAYEQEKARAASLAGRLADAKNEADNLQFQLDRIKNNPLWKASKPLRQGMHWGLRNYRRIRNLGGPKGIARKLRQKKMEAEAKKLHGTASFPSPEEAKRQQEAKFQRMVKFSILVPLWNTPLNYLEEMIGSVQAQTYQNWELCLADGSDQEHNEVEERCQAYAKDDPRIVYKRLSKNEGIAGNTNQCFAMATGEYIGLFDHDDVLHPCALYEYVKVINEQGADYIYCDETTFKGDSINNMITLHFKPDFAIDNLRANNYICHFSVFSRELLEGTELFRSGFDGSQDHDMILRLTANAKKVVHVPKLLYYWRSHKNSTASDISAKPYAIAAAKGAVADHLAKCGFRNFEIKSTRAFDTIFEIKYEILKEDKISILIPNKDHVEDLRRCITSIQERSTYDNYEIIIIENNSTENATLDYYKTLENQDKISVVKYQGDFNYAKINNFGAGYAKGAYLLLLNNDTQIISMNWLEAMLMYAQRPDVGAVGAKLYYADRTIQHAGVVIGLGAHRTAGHTHYKINYDNLGYMGKLCYAQDVSAVTGACLMVKKELFEAADGLDESFRIALNDVDFCLRLREMGYLNVFTPFAELYHFESASRGSDMVDAAKAKRYEEESQYFREKWKTVLEKGDPYYNPNFSLDYSDYSLRTVPVEKQKIKS